MTAARGIAVVIPTLDESARVASALGSVIRGAEDARAANGPIEVVIVDGGSRDDTVERARACFAARPPGFEPLRVVSTGAGRGRQLDAGWRETGADVVLFLHADTRLPPRWRTAVDAAMARPGVAGGAFRLGYDERGALWRLLEIGVQLRVTCFGLPYGDQALFVRRSVLEREGGVPHTPILEDLDLVRMIKRAGRLAVLRPRVRTSTRTHSEGGLLATLGRHVLALGGFFVGADRGWLAKRVRG